MAALLCVLVFNPPWKGPSPPGKRSGSAAASVFWPIIWLRELSAVLRMSFQMVIKLLLVILCARAERCCEFSKEPTLGIISSPSWAEDKGGGRLISEEFHKYCGCSGWGGSQSNLNTVCVFPLLPQCWNCCISLLTSSWGESCLMLKQKKTGFIYSVLWLPTMLQCWKTLDYWCYNPPCDWPLGTQELTRTYSKKRL